MALKYAIPAFKASFLEVNYLDCQNKKCAQRAPNTGISTKSARLEQIMLRLKTQKVRAFQGTNLIFCIKMDSKRALFMENDLAKVRAYFGVWSKSHEQGLSRSCYLGIAALPLFLWAK